MLKSKMVAISASSWGKSKSTGSRARTKSSEPLLDGPATSEHMSALLRFKFLSSGKYDAILDSFVTTIPTMQLRAAKVLLNVITHIGSYFSILVHTLACTIELWCKPRQRSNVGACAVPAKTFARRSLQFGKFSFSRPKLRQSLKSLALHFACDQGIYQFTSQTPSL